MPITNLYKTAFIHIPKTAGTQIEKYLGTATVEEGWRAWNRSPQHRRASEYTIPEDYFTFSVIRNPYDRMISEYLWRGRKNLYWRHRKNIPNETMEQFIIRFIETWENSWWDNHANPQSWFLDIDNIQIFRYEKINELWKILSEKINYKIPKSLPVKHNKKILSKKSIEYINDFYKEDFERFGYKKIKI